MPLTQVDQGLLGPFAQYTGFKNRIINGAMVIDQRNNGGSVSINNTAQYTLDRWYDRCVGGAGSAVISVQQSTTAPPLYRNSHQITVTTAKTPASSEQFWFYQAVEGLNVADFGLGTSSALTFTLSFWVRASVTGTYSVSFQNSAQTRSYVATYTVNAANTWEQKSITVAGDTTGTWLTTNGVGLYVFWDTGSGSNFNTTAGSWAAGTFYRTSGSVSLISNASATHFVTGVQLEEGSTATSFDYRPYGTELALCQRYYYRVGQSNFFCAFNATTSRADGAVPFPVAMRAAPTALEQSGTASDYRVIYQGTSSVCNSVPTFAAASVNGSYIRFNNASPFTVGQACLMETLNSTSFLAWSAEL